MTKTIRIWQGCKVLCTVSVSESGYSIIGPAGGAENSTDPDIELDPFAGLIVDHDAGNSPVAFCEEGA